MAESLPPSNQTALRRSGYGIVFNGLALLVILLGLGILAGLFFFPVYRDPAPPEIIRIYSSLPLTGSSAGQTFSLVNAIKLAIDQQTKEGLVCGGRFSIDYVSLDDATAEAGRWDAAQEQTNANVAATDPDAMVYIGPFNSGAAEVSIPILNAANLVMISPSNTRDVLTVGDAAAKYYPLSQRNYTRVVPRDGAQAVFGAQWAAQMGAQTVYVIDDGELYGQSMAEAFLQATATAGLKVVGHSPLDGRAADYQALAAQVADTNPDLIFYGGITQNNAGQLLRDLRAVGIKAKFMGAGGIQEYAFIDAAGVEVAEGVYSFYEGAVYDKLPLQGQQFYADYAARYGQQPEMYAIYGYEAVNVALAAIERTCQKDRQAILQAVFATQNFDGVLGTWSFDANGDIDLLRVAGYVVKAGYWETVPAGELP